MSRRIIILLFINTVFILVVLLRVRRDEIGYNAYTKVVQFYLQSEVQYVTVVGDVGGYRRFAIAGGSTGFR